ncbi:MAG: hypothetical protein ABSD44_11810 [Terracidiphilus sp.]
MRQPKGFFVTICLPVFLIADVGFTQKSPALPLKAGERGDILFAAEAPSSEKDETGKPALASLEPIAFIVGGQLRECYNFGPANAENAIGKIVLDTLNRAYAPGHRYPLWWRGVPWGEAEAVHSCIDEDLDLTGCFRLHPAAPENVVPKELNGTAFTGNPPTASHPPLRLKASLQERTLFLQAAATAFAKKDVRTAPQRIHLETVWKTQLRAGHTALVSSALVQMHADKPQTYRSYRLFLVIEESHGQYEPVLTRFHKTTLTLDSGADSPKPGEQLDEEKDTDKEVFFDNFPLFAGESDAVITRHTYYEDWNFSVYRRNGESYRLVYTGCGGGA